MVSTNWPPQTCKPTLPATILLLCSCPSEVVAAELASSLVGEKLAACVSLLPGIRSIYRWQGEIEDERECLMLIKTARAAYQKVESFLLKRHPYELPEIIVIPIETGLPAYLDWIVQSTGPETSYEI